MLAVLELGTTPFFADNPLFMGGVAAATTKTYHENASSEHPDIIIPGVYIKWEEEYTPSHDDGEDHVDWTAECDYYPSALIKHRAIWDDDIKRYVDTEVSLPVPSNIYDKYAIIDGAKDEKLPELLMDMSDEDYMEALHNTTAYKDNLGNVLQGCYGDGGRRVLPP